MEGPIEETSTGVLSNNLTVVTERRVHKRAPSQGNKRAAGVGERQSLNAFACPAEPRYARKKTSAGPFGCSPSQRRRRNLGSKKETLSRPPKSSGFSSCKRGKNLGLPF